MISLPDHTPPSKKPPPHRGRVLPPVLPDLLGHPQGGFQGLPTLERATQW